MKKQERKITKRTKERKKERKKEKDGGGEREREREEWGAVPQNALSNSTLTGAKKTGLASERAGVDCALSGYRFVLFV